MYAYPGHVSDGLIEVMAHKPKMAHYLDMPLQHGDPARSPLHRPSRMETVYDHLAKLRAAMPDIALRTTFIAGYPGETEKEFQGLLDFVAQPISTASAPSVSAPSRHPGTLANAVPEEVKGSAGRASWNCSSPSACARSSVVHSTMDVLVEGVGESARGEPLLLARSSHDTPEVDSLVPIAGVRDDLAGPAHASSDHRGTRES